MTYNDWSKKVVVLTLSIPLILVTLNFLIDPFGVFWRDPNTCVQPNERYVKIGLLKEKHTQYSGYLLGSSRIGTTEPKIIEYYKQKYKFYNLTISAGTLTELQKIVSYMIINQYNPKIFYLQVDLYDNFLSDQRDSHVLFLRLHPEIERQKTYEFLRDYLLSFSFEDLFRQVKSDLKIGTRHRRLDFLKTGCWFADEEENELLSDPKKYVENEPSFHPKNIKTINTNTKAVKANLDALKRIVSSCRNNKIQLIVFITPHNHIMQSMINFEDYKAYLTQLAQITDYWDFSGYNSVTLNDENYYEYSHYRPKIARLIAGRIFGDQNMTIPSDFGIFITNNTLQAHLNNLNKQQQQYILEEKNGKSGTDRF